MTDTPSLMVAKLASTTALMPAAAPPPANTLLDMMYDGFLLLFMMKNGQMPANAQEFAERVQRFLDEFERAAKKKMATADDIFAAKYAFCAAVDETVLGQPSAIRDAWERRPLQLTLFGDQLAGENFFTRLEQLRAQGAPRLQAIEVYYICLLLGFQGRYLLEGPEKLAYLTARLGDEIAYLKGKRAAFAPQAEAPDRVAHALRTQVPVWSVAAMLALIGFLAFIGLGGFLGRKTDGEMAQYAQVIQPIPNTARLTITLP